MLKINLPEFLWLKDKSRKNILGCPHLTSLYPEYSYPLHSLNHFPKIKNSVNFKSQDMFTMVHVFRIINERQLCVSVPCHSVLFTCVLACIMHMWWVGETLNVIYRYRMCAIAQRLTQSPPKNSSIPQIC